MVLKNALLLHQQRQRAIESAAEPEAVAAPISTGNPDAIQINLVEKEEELLPLPSIGKGRAKTLLAARPVDGFTDMAQLKALSKFDFSDEQWAQIENGIAFS
jgi:DNA uptake protein ComE-like DNA-binding protein